MIEVPEPHKVEIGDIVKFHDCEPVRVIEYTTCDECFIRGTCRSGSSPHCYRVECPSTIAFAEVL